MSRTRSTAPITDEHVSISPSYIDNVKQKITAAFDRRRGQATLAPDKLNELQRLAHSEAEFIAGLLKYGSHNTGSTKLSFSAEPFNNSGVRMFFLAEEPKVPQGMGTLRNAAMGYFDSGSREASVVPVNERWATWVSSHFDNAWEAVERCRKDETTAGVVRDEIKELTHEMVFDQVVAMVSRFRDVVSDRQAKAGMHFQEPSLTWTPTCRTEGGKEVLYLNDRVTEPDADGATKRTGPCSVM